MRAFVPFSGPLYAPGQPIRQKSVVTLMWTTLGHFWVVLHHTVMCPQQTFNIHSDLSRSPVTPGLSGKGAHTRWRQTYGTAHTPATVKIPHRCYLVEDNNTQMRSCIERWVKFNTGVISKLISHTFSSHIMERDQFASASCAYNHMWLTCLPLETTVLPWWAPQA